MIEVSIKIAFWHFTVTAMIIVRIFKENRPEAPVCASI